MTRVAPDEAPTVPMRTVDEEEFGRAMGRGLAWSLLNNLVARAGTFLAGIVIVRILDPEQYGVYAVGMVVLTVLLSANELGVSVAVVQRSGRVENIARTVSTLAIASSTLIAGVGFVLAPYVARALDTPSATALIRLLLLGVVIDGIGSVPNAFITRAFAQRTRLKIDMAAFLISTPITIAMAEAGFGAWSLGWGTIAGNLVGSALAIVLAPTRVWPGWNPAAAREVLRFGLPLAGASLLLLAMLNVDYIVVGHRLGTVQLGLYVLAFNLCAWPITIISTAIRRVALAAFARMSELPDRGRERFAQVAGLVITGTLPLCVLLAGYAEPIVGFLYGERWLAAANVVRFLAVLSAGRIAVELAYDFLAGIGRTRSNLWLHAVWLIVLIPTLTIAAGRRGITGVAMGHALVVCVVVIPMLALLLARTGVCLRSVAKHLGRPVLGAALIGASVFGVLRVVPGYWPQIVVGGAVAVAVYVPVVAPMRRVAKELWNMRTAEPAPSVSVDDQQTAIVPLFPELGPFGQMHPRDNFGGGPYEGRHRVVTAQRRARYIRGGYRFVDPARTDR